MIRWLVEEGKNILKRDPAMKSLAEAVLLSPGLRALFYHRISHYFYLRKKYFLAGYVSQMARRKTGIEIHPGATIGRRVFIDHGMGIVIGETATIGDDVTIFHGVTLGGIGGKPGQKRHPSVGNGVLLGSGAKVLGAIEIGDDSKIGANSVVLENVPKGATAVGSPARIIVKNSRNHIKII